MISRGQSQTNPEGGAVLFESMTWRAVRELVESGLDVAILPIGATEQHGLHLPVSTDTEIAFAICREASARTGIPVLPTLPISSSGAHTNKWPGTLSLPGPLLVVVLLEIATWVRASGFRKLVIVNAHVGNIGPLKVAANELRDQGTLRISVAHWWELTPEITADVTSDADDWHANAAETSLMLHLQPSLVRTDLIEDDPDRTEGLVFGYTVAETSVNGLTGSPSKGSAEDGSRLFEAAVGALVETLKRARVEEPPDVGESGNQA